VGARTLERRSRRHITTLIQPFKNSFLSKNLEQNMPKNAYSLKKSCNIAAADPLPDPRVIVTSAY